MVIFVHFTLLAILIALIGLFGLVTYTTNFRFREIAIRKVLGAHPASLMIMLMKEYLMLIVIANVLAAPIAWYAMQRWMESFYYTMDISVMPFVTSLILTMFFGLLAVFFRTRKAVKKTPVDAIKYE
jgi:putative ABC transport system permease protein